MSKYTGKDFISDLKLYSDYLKWNEKENRYETWEEACNDILQMHVDKYGNKIQPLVDEIKPNLYNKELLASQRTLQFRKEQIFKHNCKLYNCSTVYAYSPDVFNKAFYVLLCGSGLGISLRNKFVSQLPKINKRENGTKTFIIPDSIEGWADAVKVLISSYCQHPSLLEEYFNCQIRFDYSQIREKGSHISGGFKAPGYEGLKQGLEKIEQLLDKELGENKSIEFRSIIAYDILMHCADAVLSGGVRRSATLVLIDYHDKELLNAKTGDWWIANPQRARSNNSVALHRNSFDKEKLNELISLNIGRSDLGFIFVDNENTIVNPCAEIGFSFYDEIKDKTTAVFQKCNLNEINASACCDQKGNFSEEKFYELCRSASILGTFQAGYTDFSYLGKQTEEVVKGEALLGVSITGWMARPELFNAEILQNGANIVKETNKEVAKLIGINQSARTTTVKPSGNASTILKTPSGIHPEHSKRYFRIMQLNKESETAKFLELNYSERIEESKWSSTNSDYVVYSPCETADGTLYKDEMTGIKHLELIKLVQENWIIPGTNKELSYNEKIHHSVSNTVIIDDIDEITDYIYDNQDIFAAISFITQTGDKNYTQAPFTSVLNGEELLTKYGNGVIFASGLIVDGLHYFNNDLWQATDLVLSGNEITGTRDQVLLRKDWFRRVKKFAKNYFKGNLEEAVYCLKDVHLYHKWEVIMRNFKKIDFTEFLSKPNYIDIDTTGAVACAGGQCEL